jgi:diguanylate cyclase (GGDEF)-like protein
MAAAILVGVGVLAVVALAFAFVLRDRARTRLRAHVHIDMGTKLPDRAAWDSAVPRELARSRRHGLPFSIVLLDLLDLNELNLRKGRNEGDEALRRTAKAWRETLREEDLLVRAHGKRFAVLLPHCEPGEAQAMAAALRDATTDDLTVAMGVAAWDGIEPAAALETRAEQALQRDKRRQSATRSGGAHADPPGFAGRHAGDERRPELARPVFR